MAKIRTGKGYDDATSEIELKLRPESSLEFLGGDQHNRAKQSIKVNEFGGHPDAAPAPISIAGSSATNFWAKGSFLLVAFALIATVIGILAYKLAWFLVPTAVVGTIVVLYLISIVLVPHGPLTEKGLLSMFREYLRLVFAVRPTPGLKRSSKKSGATD